MLDEPIADDEAEPTLETHLVEGHVRAVVSTCTGGLSHHFNNVLSGVLGLVSLAPNLDGSALGELCERLKTQVDHTSGILRLVLTLTRRAERESAERRCEIRNPVKAAVDLWRTAAPPHVAIELRGDVEETWLPTSAVTFGQLLLVSLAAAVEHSGGVGEATVGVTVARRSGTVAVAIDSSGGWAAVAGAPSLKAALAAGRAPPAAVLARAAMESLAGAAGGEVQFVGPSRCELCLPMLALPGPA